MKRLRVTAAVVLILLACGDDSGGKRALTRGPSTSTGTAITTSTTSPTTAPPTTAPPTSEAALPPPAPEPPPPPPPQTTDERLTRVATLTEPIAATVRPGDPGLWLAEKGGAVRVLRDGQLSGPVLSLAASTASEQGLLGIAFSPDGQWFVASYTDPAGDSHVDRWAVGADGSLSGQTSILFVDQPYANHNGGNVVFGPDGHLYLGLGDGGAGGDPENRAQNPGTMLGKLVRFGQTVPPDAPEIWASGLRNPWRFSFDRATQDLWLADVGQGTREEIDHVALGSLPGANFGWPGWEGSAPYKADQQKPGSVFPVYEYGHDGGRCSITGGYVYRGAALTHLAGVYLYGDFCDGEVHALFPDGSDESLGVRVDQLASFAEDAAGELYVLSLSGGVYRIDPA